MAKLQDKLYNRIIEGNLTLDENDSAKSQIEIIAELVAKQIVDDDYIRAKILSNFGNENSLVTLYGLDKDNSPAYQIASEHFSDQIVEAFSNGCFFGNATHSFNELDATLKQIVDDSIGNGGLGVSCTTAQWKVIKALLDKSLYINYGGTSLIKTYADGIGQYVFGCIVHEEYGMSLRVQYDEANQELSATYIEV